MLSIIKERSITITERKKDTLHSILRVLNFCFGKNKYADLVGEIIWDPKDWFAMSFFSRFFADEILSKYLHI